MEQDACLQQLCHPDDNSKTTTVVGPYKIVLFYKYVSVPCVDTRKEWFLGLCNKLELLGRVLVATEGINGTVAGPGSSIDKFVAECSLIFENVDWKVSSASGSRLPFNDLHIKLVPELIGCGEQKQRIDKQVSFDVSLFGGLSGTGVHLTPQQFHEALNKNENDKLLLDIRNEFEYDIGRFRGAASLRTNTYAETWQALDSIFEDTATVDKPVYLYCTGGIRCEKASAYLKTKGVKQVFQLQGGIHKYLEQFKESGGGHFEGKEFVFDARVALTSSTADAAPEDAPALQVVGKCIDCCSPYDQYHGQAICTVCHMPVLCCPTCVHQNPFPGEYYCRNHRCF
jgi:predicted sulfurtransferase